MSPGKAHTRRLQGTGPTSIIETQVTPKHRMRIPIAPCGPDLAPGPAFPRGVGAQDDRRPGGHQDCQAPPEQTPTALAVDHVARGNTRWSVVTWRSMANPIPRKAAVTVRGPAVSIAPERQTCAWPQTRSETSGAHGANARMIVSGRDGIMGCPPSIA